VVTDADDLFAVPFAGWFEEILFGLEGTGGAVDGAVVLIGGEAFVFFVAVVEDLDFHADVGGVALAWIAETDAVIGAWFEFEFEVEDEVAVFFFGAEESAGGSADDGAVLDFVA